MVKCNLFRCLPLRPVLPAEGDIAFIAAEHHLGSFLDHSTIRKPRIIRRLPAAPTHGLDLLNGVSPGQKPMGAFKQIPLEVSAQAIADHGDTEVVHDVDEVLNLLLCQELRFIDDDAGDIRFIGSIRRHGVIGGRKERGQLLHEHTGLGQAGAAGDDPLAVAVVELRFHKECFLAALLIVESYHEGVGGLGRSHCAVFKIKLCHFSRPLFQFINLKISIFSGTLYYITFYLKLE